MEHGQFQVDVTIVTNTLCQRLPTHVTVGIFLTCPLTRRGEIRGGGKERGREEGGGEGERKGGRRGERERERGTREGVGKEERFGG